MELLNRVRPSAVALDVDRGALKAVQVSEGAGRHVLRHVGYRRLPEGVIDGGEVVDADVFAGELRQFWESHEFRGHSVLLGLANQKIVARFIDFPRMSPEDLAGAVGFEAPDHIPMPAEEAVMDHVALGPAEPGSDLDRVLVVAADKEMVSRYTAAAREAGLRPVGVDVKTLSLTRSVLPESVFEGEDATLLLDVGTEMTSLVVAQGRRPTLLRFLPGGAARFVAAVSETAGIGEEEAEQQLANARVRLDEEREGSGEAEEDEGWDPALAYDVRRGLEAAVGELAEDVRRSVEYHASQPGAREVVRAFVSGEGTLVGGVEEYLGGLIGVPAQRGEPLRRISANKSNVTDEQLGVMAPVLAVAVGLAIEET